MIPTAIAIAMLEDVELANRLADALRLARVSPAAAALELARRHHEEAAHASPFVGCLAASCVAGRRAYLLEVLETKGGSTDTSGRKQTGES
jgi:hypothetical protein